MAPIILAVRGCRFSEGDHGRAVTGGPACWRWIRRNLHTGRLRLGFITELPLQPIR